MIIFLSVLCAVSVFADGTLIEKRDGPAIKIEWTKTEKLKISIPVIGLENAVKTPHNDQTTTPMLPSATTSALGTGIPTQAPVDYITNTAVSTTASWSEGSTMESDTAMNSPSTISLTVSGRLDSTTIPFSTSVEENSSRTSDIIVPEATTTFSSVTAEENPSRTTDNISNSPEITASTTTTTTTTTTGTTAPPCEDSQGKDFMFLIDEAAVKERTKIEELIGEFLKVIKNGDPCDRIALATYADIARVLIKLKVGVDNVAVVSALRSVNYTQRSDLPDAMRIFEKEILNWPRFRTYNSYPQEYWPQFPGLALKDAGKQLFVIIVATGEGSAGDDWNEKDRRNAAINRAMLTDKYDAHILLVTIGQPRFPVFQYVASDDETVKIESFENFSHVTAINEFCCRFSLCSVDETEMCARVKTREVEKRILYPKCEEAHFTATDAIILIDQAGMNHRSEIVGLAESFVNLMDPWKTKNGMGFASYSKLSSHLFPHDHTNSKEYFLTKIRKTEYALGSNIINGLGDAAFRDKGMGKDDWQKGTRQRIVIIIASGVPSFETGVGFVCSRYNSSLDFDACVRDTIAGQRSVLTGLYGAKVFLIAIGDLPIETLRHIAPEKEIVKVESIEKLSIPSIIEEFKRRFCL